VKKGIIAAMVLIVLVNAVVLLGAFRNRSGADSVLEMTERELRLDISSRENSGVSFRIDVNRDWDKPLEWFDRRKLTEVGFDLTGWKPNVIDATGTKKILPRRAYVVLEYQGNAWKQWDGGMRRDIEKAARKELREEKEKKDREREIVNLEWRRTHASRLFPVDVGLDPGVLRSRYPDRRRYALAPAVVNLMVRYGESPNTGNAKVFGSISEILCDQVTIPLSLQGQLTEFLRKTGVSWSEYYSNEKTAVKSPRYTAVIKFGKRYEPWVESVMRIKSENQLH